MIRATLSAVEARLCGPSYLDVPALWSSRRVLDAGGPGAIAVDSGEAAAVVVGEAPGPRTSRWCPMFPFPSTSAGGRLLTMSGIPAEEYLRRFARRNLFDVYPGPGGWNKKERIAAQARALEVFEDARGGRIVMLGAQVARAFAPITGGMLGAFEYRKDCSVDGLSDARCSCAGTEFVALPHPSGRSRTMNDQATRTRVRRTLREFASTPLPPCPACSTSSAVAYEYPQELTCHCGARLTYRRGIGSIEIDCVEAA